MSTLPSRPLPASLTVTPDELAEDIRQHARGMPLYNPDGRWFHFEYGGRQFWVPPDLGGKATEHPVETDAKGRPLVVKGDGILEVKDQYGFLFEKPGSRKVTGYGLLPGMDAIAIVVYAQGNYGNRGIVWLRGDETDEDRKRFAKAQLVKAKRAWAEEEVQARAAFLEHWKRTPSHQGRIPPPPTVTQREAQEFLDSNLAADQRTGAEFMCPFWDYETEDWDRYARHMRVAHGKQVTKARPAPGAPQTEPAGDEQAV